MNFRRKILKTINTIPLLSFPRKRESRCFLDSRFRGNDESRTSLNVIPVFTFFLVLFFSFTVFADSLNLYQKSGHRSAKWDGLIKAGFEAFDNGEVTTSYAFMQKAYNLGCRDGLLLFNLGIYHESKKEYKDAVKFLSEASQKLTEQYQGTSEEKRIHEHLGRIYYQTDQLDRALPEMETALKNDPENFLLLFMTGEIYKIQKSYPQAIANLEKALMVKKPADLKPDPTKTILTELMTIYYETKDYNSSLKYAEMILSANPSDQTALSYKQIINKEEFKKREKEAVERITK